MEEVVEVQLVKRNRGQEWPAECIDGIRNNQPIIGVMRPAQGEQAQEVVRRRLDCQVVVHYCQLGYYWSSLGCCVAIDGGKTR